MRDDAKAARRRAAAWGPRISLTRALTWSSGCRGPTAVITDRTWLETVYVPLRGVSALDREGQPFWWPEADQALFQSLRDWMSPHVRLVELDLHINDPEFARAAVATLRGMISS